MAIGSIAKFLLKTYFIYIDTRIGRWQCETFDECFGLFCKEITRAFRSLLRHLCKLFISLLLAILIERFIKSSKGV